MKMRLPVIFQFCVLLIMPVCIGVPRANAQGAGPAPTNAPASTNAPAGTNAPPVVEREERESANRFASLPVLTFGLDRIPVLRREVPEGIPLWQYGASLIYVFLAFYLSKILDFLTRVWLKRLAVRTRTKFDDLVLDIINGPVKIISFVILLHIGLNIFKWPAWVSEVFSKGLKIVVAISLTYMVTKLIDLALGYWRRRTTADVDQTFDQQLFPIIRKSLKVFVVIVAALLTSHNLGINVTSVIASLSIGGLALGLAAQDTLANLFGAVSVFVDKPFRVGDRIQLDAVDGTVESIGLRSTRVRNLDGYLVTIPNKTMGNATIINIALRPNIKNVMNIGLTYDTTPAKLREALDIIEKAYRSHKSTFDVIVAFNQFADSALNILVIHWWVGTDARASLAGLQEMNLLVKERIEAAGINFAFPTRTIHLKQDSAWKVEGKAEEKDSEPKPAARPLPAGEDKP